MNIKRAGLQPSAKGLRIGSRAQCALIRSSKRLTRPRTRRKRHLRARARTAWHTHPLGQTLVITSGLGRVQRWGGPVEEIRPGDVVWFEPDEKHWHGASPTVAMTHIAIQKALNGKVVDWMEKVSDEQYNEQKR